MYQIQNGTLSLIRRHNEAIMKAYNICPDKEIIEQKQNQTTMLTDNTMTKGLQDTSTVSKSELEDSRTIDIEDGQATGAAFWHRPAKRLKE